MVAAFGSRQSHAIEDYAKSIYSLQRRAGGDPVSTNALAERCGVTPASASAMLKKLAERGLVEHVPYKGVLLTAEGQRVALEGLAGRPGAVVALDVNTGEVLVMASTPSFDPNAVDRPATFTALNRDESAPLLNRATQGLYPPGSTFKVVTAAAALDSGRYTPGSAVDGRNGKVISGVPLNNFGGASFGFISLTDALTQSVNTVWAEVGVKLGRRTMRDYMERFGFYADPPLDYPDDQMSASGVRKGGRLVPMTSDAVDVGRVAIGQGDLLASPLQMAMVASAVANDGTLMRPTLTDRVVDRDGRTVERIEPEELSEVMRPATAKTVGDMMASVVREGTGTAAALDGVDVAGKTGTAEIIVAQNVNQPWFIGFAPRESPRIAVAVTIERSTGTGGEVAAPIAKRVMEALLSG